MIRPRSALVLAVALVAGCGPAEPPPRTADKPEGQGGDSARYEIPPEHLAAMLSAHDRGLGAMERYEYGDGVEAFGEVHRLAPNWVPGSINLAIALLIFGESLGAWIADQFGLVARSRSSGVSPAGRLPFRASRSCWRSSTGPGRT